MIPSASPQVCEGREGGAEGRREAGRGAREPTTRGSVDAFRRCSLRSLADFNIMFVNLSCFVVLACWARRKWDGH